MVATFTFIIDFSKYSLCLPHSGAVTGMINYFLEFHKPHLALMKRCMCPSGKSVKKEI